MSACMIGKCTLENYPGSKEPDPRPMALVHMDVYSSSGTSLEGYNHAVIVTDSRSEHRWHSLAVWNEYKGRSLGNVKEMPVGGRNGRHPEGSSDFGCSS